MNKQELINQIAKKTKMSKTSILAITDEFLGTIENSLSKGNKVQIVGFGTWGTRKRKARNGRNPQTGAPLRIPARTVPYFSAGKGLKEAVH
jgi:DNA-binding protein HU-beta